MAKIIRINKIQEHILNTALTNYYNLLDKDRKKSKDKDGFQNFELTLFDKEILKLMEKIENSKETK